jgi:hypothetical protein
MKNRRASKLKRNPLVRFIRKVFKLLKTLFKPNKKGAFKFIRDRQFLNNERISRIATNPVDESSERVKWQNTTATVPEQISDDRRIVPIHNVPRDRLITVGELCDRVKWQVKTVDVPAQISDDSGMPPIYNVSREQVGTVGELLERVEWQNKKANL